MSRLIDRLNQAAKTAPQPMGFMAARAASSGPRILLIAGLAQGRGADRLADEADAILLRPDKSRLTAKALQTMTKTLPDMPWGAWLDDIDDKKRDILIGAGGDFLVFQPDSRVAAAPDDEKVGRILLIPSATDDGLLRAVNDLPVDAVLVNDMYEAGKAMAWHQLINIQRLANLLNKPLIVTIPLNTGAGELKALWEAGVDGVVVEADAGKPGGIKELRRIIGELPPRSVHKKSKAEALLPKVGPESSKPIPEEEEEEEDEE